MTSDLSNCVPGYVKNSLGGELYRLRWDVHAVTWVLCGLLR